MQISPVSFGKKIPRATVQIQNRKNHKFVPATFSEVDCRDVEDYERIRGLNKNWFFSNRIADDMQIRYEIQNVLKSKSDNSFFIIEDEKEDIVGIAEVSSTNGVYDVSFLESSPKNKYKFVGQTMLAAIGNEVLKKGGLRYIISTALDDVMDFYTKVCGFKLQGDFLLKMNHKDIEQFKAQTEERTQSKIMDVEG